jgi:hypothetical protein
MQINTESVTLRFMTRYWPVTFAIMTLSFLAFGALSVNLAQTFLVNIQLIREYGMMALRDGAFLQLMELLLTACFAVAFYVCFKTCESALVQRIFSRK